MYKLNIPVLKFSKTKITEYGQMKDNVMNCNYFIVINNVFF